ncbi:hypothetical protein PF010_g8511 [Phytophthora fragariae]|uniref:Uncharacterized protein n=1 Tax=Phytophthora fragariae TaxID=53985 RepID=A0A6G0LF55_9STRA|nr:hypothetical protein PF010_g8511 [Phytophthora fragariae]
MSPSPPRAPRAACLAASMGGVSIHGVASKMSPSPPVRPPCCLRRHINGRSESPRRGNRHQHRVRELAVRQQHHKLVVLHRNVTIATPCPPYRLRRRRDGQSASPRGRERHEHRRRELDNQQQQRELVLLHQNVTIASSASA